tara:strand:+ start:2391 stop:2990 length:600 start_codon:yes stop_codon:yes gene_type:complete
MSKLVIQIMVLLITTAVTINASPNDLYDPNNPTGNVSLINDITVIQTNEIGEFNTTAYANYHILTFTIDNNHPNGFIIEIGSNNGSKFINENLNQNGVTGKGTYVDYTVTTIHNETDDQVGGSDQTYWGPSSLPNHADFTLTNESLDNPVTLTFSGTTHGITQATRNFKYRILLSSGINKSLFAGQLEDELTISITSIE